MTYSTDEELDALVGRMSKLADDMEKHATYDWDEHEDVRATLNVITALRAQLAEAKAGKEKLGRELNLARYGQPDFSWQVHKEALAAANARADRAEEEVRRLKAAIFGSENYAQDLKCGNFVEMAKTLHAAQKGGLERAERAEAALAAQIEVDAAKYGPRANEGLLPNLGLQQGDRVVRVTGHDKWSDPDIGSEYTFCINSDYRKGVPHLVRAGSGWTTMNDKGTFRVIGRKPHDHAALNHLLAEAEAKALWKAAAKIRPSLPPSGNGIVIAALHRVADAIEAMIPKEGEA